MSSTHILKFLNDHNSQRYLAKKTYQNNTIFQQSDSYINQIPQLSKNKSNPILCSSINSNSNYITKKLPPIQTYNVVHDEYQQIARPEYIVKQKPTYPINYSYSLQQGYKKKQGQFQAYIEILNKNSPLLKQLSTKIEKSTQLSKKSVDTKSSLHLPLVKYIPSKSMPKNIEQEKKSSNVDENEVKRSNYLAHNNVFDNQVQHEIDRQLIQKKLIQKKMIRQPLNKNDSSYRKIRLNSKLYKKDYEVNDFEDENINIDELSDVLGKCNEIDEEDENELLGKLTNFDRMVEEINEFRNIDEKKKKIEYNRNNESQ